MTPKKGKRIGIDRLHTITYAMTYFATLSIAPGVHAPETVSKKCPSASISVRKHKLPRRYCVAAASAPVSRTAACAASTSAVVVFHAVAATRARSASPTTGTAASASMAASVSGAT